MASHQEPMGMPVLGLLRISHHSSTRTGISKTFSKLTNEMIDKIVSALSRMVGSRAAFYHEEKMDPNEM